MDMDCERAIREVMAADFTCYDLALYLNTHPFDTRALAVYYSSVQRARSLRENYERMCGPLTAQASTRTLNCWEWALTPWPWEWQ
ncbi:MAG: spore coat protein CotJB [Bacillota bacterium]|nr:spore coat protein CotJB [Bacillota bacterium]